MNEEQRCWSCTYFNAGPSECTYPPTNAPEAMWRFVSRHNAHPVKTDAGLGRECKTFESDPTRVEVEALKAGNYKLTDVLLRNGFRRCHNIFCNCGSWHYEGGYRARMDEITEALAEAG